MPSGNIVRQDDLLYIRFPFNKKRFEAIKRIGKANYDKESKCWKLPIQYLSKLESSELFSPNSIKYDFDFEQARERLEEISNETQTAIKRVSKNPFVVSEEDIKLVDVEIVFRLSPSSTIWATPKYRSRAKKLLESVPGTHYIKSKRTYFFPVEHVSEFTKILKDNKFSFAFEEHAGKKLIEGAEARKKALENPKHCLEIELRRALLSPYISLEKDKTGAPKFSLKNASTEQLRICFPELKSFQEKKSKALSMNQLELTKLLYEIQGGEVQLWMTKDVWEFIDNKAPSAIRQIKSSPNGFDDSLLAVALPEYCWLLNTEDNKGALLIENSHLEQLGNLFKGNIRKSYSDPDYTIIDFENLDLLEKFELTQQALKDSFEAPAPISSSFRELVKALIHRKQKLARHDHYQSLNDCELNLENKELESKLYPHQRVAVAWMKEFPAALLGDDMGLGKTLSILASFEDDKNSDFLLVACPNSLVFNWIREAKTWLPNMNFGSLPTNKKERLDFINSGEIKELDGLVVNFETLRLEYVYPELMKLCEERSTLLCVDESQRAKNPSSKTFLALRAVAALCPRRVLLSGTPTPKDISDIWAQMLLIDGGERFGTNFYAWLETVAELGNKWSEFAVNSFIPERVEETILQVQEVLLRRKKEDVVDLPEKTFSTRDIQLSGEQKKRFDEIRKDLLVRISSKNGKSFVKEIESILEEYLRAVQAASNPRLIDESFKGEPAKFLELDSIVQEVVKEKGEKLVIWTNYRLNVDELVERYSEYGARPFSGDVSKEERAETIEDFQNTQNCKILVAIPAAGGVGITLTAAQTAVYIDKTWNAEHWLQSIDRIHRIGQTGTVSIISLNATKVDNLISANLRRKQKEQSKLLGDDLAKQENYLFPSQSELIEALN